MLRLTLKDKKIIENSYEILLSELTDFFISNEIKNALDCYNILYNMLKNGQFCIGKSINFNPDFNYLDLPNMDYMGAQVMYGVCCCRHVSAFINDVLSLLGFNTSLFYIYIDNKMNWHKSTIVGANHVTVLLMENEEEYILDPMNNYILNKNKDGSLKLVDLVESSLYNSQFLDDNIQNIGKTLKKYYNLRDLGINYVYD